LRVAACLCAWLAFPGGDLGGFAPQLAGFIFRQDLHKCLYLGKIVDFERTTILHVRLKPKNTRVARPDTPDTNEARGPKRRQSSYGFSATIGEKILLCNPPTSQKTGQQVNTQQK
jgi:hypothetical protein